MLVVGETPIAAALVSLGTELDLAVLPVSGGTPEPAVGDLALVVAAHGRDELHTLRRGLEVGVPYVGLVASHKRGAGVLAELRADGVSEAEIERIDVPAGLDIGSRTAAEIALSILASVVAARRGKRAAAPGNTQISVAAPTATLGVDPICGMTVAAVPGTPSLEHEGRTVYFCCDGCKSKFEAQHRAA